MSFLYLLTAETRRQWQHIRAYWLDLLADQLLFTIMFLFFSGIIYLLTKGSYSQETLFLLLIGFLTWRVADGCLLDITNNSAEDAKIGVLEQLHLTAFAPETIILARSLIIFLYHACRAIILAATLLLILQIPLWFSCSLLLVFLIVQAGVLGIAYAIVGCHLAYKNVAAITIAISTVLLFLTGAITPLDNAPLLSNLTNMLPLTIGIRLLRVIALQDLTLVDVLRQSDFYWLLLSTTIYSVTGWCLLQWGQQKARQQGSLAHY